MDKGDAIQIANKFVALISQKYSVRKAILFGSFAKGTNHNDSDIDIALILDSSDDIIDTQIEMMKLRRDIDLRIEPHPFRRQDFKRTNPVANEIMKYGIEIS